MATALSPGRTSVVMLTLMLFCFCRSWRGVGVVAGLDALKELNSQAQTKISDYLKANSVKHRSTHDQQAKIQKTKKQRNQANARVDDGGVSLFRSPACS